MSGKNFGVERALGHDGLQHDNVRVADLVLSHHCHGLLTQHGLAVEAPLVLDMLVLAKLGREANALMEAEGWKWAQVHLDYPHSHGQRRIYPQPVDLSAEDRAALDAAQSEFNSLTAQYESAEELPDDVDARFGT